MASYAFELQGQRTIYLCARSVLVLWDYCAVCVRVCVCVCVCVFCICLCCPSCLENKSAAGVKLFYVLWAPQTDTKHTHTHTHTHTYTHSTVDMGSFPLVAQ